MPRNKIETMNSYAILQELKDIIATPPYLLGHRQPSFNRKTYRLSFWKKKTEI